MLQRLRVTTTSQSSEPCSVCGGATLEDLTTGKATELTPCTLYFRRGSVTEPEQYLYLDIHFHQSHQYRVTVTPPITTDSFTATVLTNTVVMENHVTGSAGAVTHAFQNPPDNLGMLVVVSFHAGTGVLPVLTRSGEAVPMIWSRDIDGKKEAVFAQSGQVRNGETLQLQFTCPKNGEIVFYDWGIMLL